MAFSQMVLVASLSGSLQKMQGAEAEQCLQQAERTPCCNRDRGDGLVPVQVRNPESTKFMGGFCIDEMVNQEVGQLLKRSAKREGT